MGLRRQVDKTAQHFRGGTTMASQVQGGASAIDVTRASSIDVAEFIDQQPVGGFQVRLLLTCAAVLFLDGFDTQAIGYVAPALQKNGA
jgi:MFS transporter, AAHS family, 4-hydroxybenzoate transporter